MRDSDQLILEKMYQQMRMLNEIAWDKYPEIKDKSSCIPPEKMRDILNAIIKRADLPADKREKRNKNLPIIHSKSLKLDKEGGVDVQDFIDSLTRVPERIFGVNEKAEHSTNKDFLTINTGIPAFKALLWDEEANEFRVITTCPGAGQCVIGCFAMLGNYVRLPQVVMNYARKFQYLMSDPDGYEKKAYSEALGWAAQAEGVEKVLEIRWNDSGDFFSKTYFEIAKNVTQKVLKRGFEVKSYIYTKSGDIIDMAEEAGFVTTFSTDARRSEKEKIDPLKKKLAIRVPRKVTKGILQHAPKGKGYVLGDDGKPKFRDADGREKLKDVIYDYYSNREFEGDGLTRDSLVYTDELPEKQDSEKYIYNVIVLPKGDSDFGAQRTDVKNSYLMEH